MADFRVTRPSALDLFLRKQGIQNWRIPVLIDCGAVKVVRNGAEIALLKGVLTHVKEFDIVKVIEPLPPACRKAYEKAVSASARDYAFVPGKTKFDDAMGKLMENRPETIRLNEAGMTDLTVFIDSLERSPLITNPIRHLIIASHANDEGQLVIKLGLISGRKITYEDLVDAVKKKSILVKEHWLKPRPKTSGGAEIPPLFLVRGCRIGAQPVFLKKLKEAFGNKITVIAPKHFDVVFAHTGNPPGYMEYMAYSFPVTSPTKLKDKTAVVDALLKAGHETIDKQPVSQKKWEAWVPSNPHKQRQQEDQTSVLDPITNKAAKVPRWFRYEARQWLPAAEKLAVDKKVVSNTDRKNVLKSKLKTRPDFQDTHPFPIFKRYGYDTLDKFMDGWTWEFTPKKAAEEVTFNATRHEYTVIQPVTEAKDGKLLLNFYPTTKKGKVIELLDVTDNRLFETV